MEKTETRYADGSIKYKLNCSECKSINTCLGRKKQQHTILCKECRLRQRRKTIKDTSPGTSHGLTSHPLYNRWKLMKARCYNTNNPRYNDWGGRGIKVCNEWLSDAEKYIKYTELLDNAMLDGYTVDRIDNDGNYEPGNIKWSTKSEQNLNQRFKKTNTGEPLIISETHLSEKYTYYRVLKKGDTNKRKSFKTLDLALNYRKDNYGF